MRYGNLPLGSLLQFVLNLMMVMMVMMMMMMMRRMVRETWCRHAVYSLTSVLKYRLFKAFM